MILKVTEDQWINADTFKSILLKVSWDRKFYLLNLEFIFKTTNKDKESFIISPIGQTELVNEMGLDLDNLTIQEIINAAAHSGYGELSIAIFTRYKKLWDEAESKLNLPSFCNYLCSLIVSDSPNKDEEIITKLTECNKIFTNKLKILLKGEE